MNGQDGQKRDPPDRVKIGKMTDFIFSYFHVKTLATIRNLAIKTKSALPSYLP
jgi:hypothetical protein